MADERIWLKHTETGHFFHCPAGAVDDFAERGWAPTDERPVEDNPVIAERLAWEAEQLAAQASAAAAAPSRTSTKAPAGPAPQTEE